MVLGSYPGSADDLEIQSDECRFSQGNLNTGHYKENVPFLNKLKSTIAFNFSKETKGSGCQLFLKDPNSRIPLVPDAAVQHCNRSVIRNIDANTCPLVAPLLPTNTHSFIIADK